MTTVDHMACRVLRALEKCAVPYMLVGAYSSGVYAIPRSTKDVDVVLSLQTPADLDPVVSELAPVLEFDPQVTFETITGSLRYILRAVRNRSLQVEFFLLGDDPFVVERFSRRVRVWVPVLEMEVSLPTAEDVIVQKLRWGRAKDIEDARDVLAVQTPARLDMEYVKRWCEAHGTLEKLRTLLVEIAPFL